jgi:DNA-binding MarR family transcriptional regulator
MATVSEAGFIGLATRLAKTIHRHSNEEILGISLRAFVVLGYLHEHDSVPQQELGDAMCLDPNSIVLLLHELEDDEYITRRRNRSDRRRHIIELTDAGRSAFASAEQGSEQIEDLVLAGLDAGERDQLRVLIGKALDGAASDEPAMASAPAAANGSAAPSR